MTTQFTVHVPSDWSLDSYSVQANSEEAAIEAAEEGDGEHIAQQGLTYPIENSWAEKD